VIVFTEALGPGREKPHPAAFEQLEREVGLRGDRCAYVADNPAKDFVTPHRLGWRTVRVRRADSLYANVRSGGDIDAEITSLDNLYTALAWDNSPTSNHIMNDFRRGIAPSEQIQRRRGRRGAVTTPTGNGDDAGDRRPTLAHLTTIDSSLRYLLYPQLTAVRDLGATAWVSASRDRTPTGWWPRGSATSRCRRRPAAGTRSPT
jgi:hypothetical protein